MKKVIALLLTLALVTTLFAACSPSSEIPSTTAPTTTANSDNISDEPEELVEISFWLGDSGNTGSGSKVKLVEDLVNSITEKEIGVHVNFNWVASADYATQLTLAVGNNETVDLATNNPQPSGSFLAYYSNGLMMGLNDLIDEYGKDLKELFGEELLNGTTIDGELYNISTYRLLNSNYYTCIRTDTLESLGMLEKAQNMTSWDEYAEICQAIKESGTTMYPITATNHTLFGDHGGVFPGGSYSNSTAFDILGDSQYMIWTDQNGAVDLIWNQPDKIKEMEMTSDWYKKGYIHADSVMSNNQASDTNMLNQLGASTTTQSEFGVEINKRQSFGTDVTCVEVAPGYLSTSSVTKFGIFIPITAAEPEASMKFINLLYTNKELANALIWGVEDETYVINDKGEAAYPEGTDISSCGYHNMDFTLGNQFLVTPWEGLGGDFRVRAAENFAQAPKSVYLGLTVDTSTIDNIVAQVSAVKDEYLCQMVGGLYTEEMYDEFMSKLKSAGIDDYLGLFKEAVEEFKAQ